MISIKDALFDEDLRRIKESLCEMADLVSESLRNAIYSLEKKDNYLAKRVVEEDDAIDLKEMEIEEKCLQVIALRHPIRERLREVFTILKIVTDLERMGDEATNIADFALRIMDEPDLISIGDISAMARVCDEMLRNSIRAFLEKDATLAEEAFKRDNVVDGFYRKIFNDLLVFMLSDSGMAKGSTSLIFIARFLERFGDHATNIAERVYYMITGKRIKVELGIKRGYQDE